MVLCTIRGPADDVVPDMHTLLQHVVTLFLDPVQAKLVRVRGHASGKFAVAV